MTMSFWDMSVWDLRQLVEMRVPAWVLLVLFIVGLLIGWAFVRGWLK